jgi:protoporphyrinogen oxidase
MQENKYDLTVVGGGIGGLYTIFQYLKKITPKNKPRILLLESNARLGGRVMTIHNKGYTYESGAGRFSKDHKLLFDLIKEFDLESKLIPLDNNQIFISKNDPGNPITLGTQNDEIIKMVKSHNFSDKYLSTHTLYQAIKDVSPDLAKKFSNYYAYYSELYIMNAKDALKSFERDFSNKIKYYVLAGGLEQLINQLYDNIKKYTILDIKLNTKVESITRSSLLFNIQTNQKTSYLTNKLVLALPSKKILDNQ